MFGSINIRDILISRIPSDILIEVNKMHELAIIFGKNSLNICIGLELQKSFDEILMDVEEVHTGKLLHKLQQRQ